MSIPEYHQHEEFQNRSRKLSEIRALGIDPYPPKYIPTKKSADLAFEMEGNEKEQPLTPRFRDGSCYFGQWVKMHSLICKTRLAGSRSCSIGMKQRCKTWTLRPI